MFKIWSSEHNPLSTYIWHISIYKTILLDKEF